MKYPFLQAMRTMVVTAVFPLVLTVAAPLEAFSPDHLNQVTFVNQTGYDVVYLFFSPSDSEYWGVDILGAGRTLDAGQKLTFYVYYADACNTFDFLAIDIDGDAYTMWDVELCDGVSRVIPVSLSELAGPFGEMEFATVTLDNRLMERIDYLFVSPADSDSWGVDILDARTTLAPGTGTEILILRSSAEERYDLLAVDSDLDRYRFRFLVDESRAFTFAIEYSDLEIDTETEVTAALDR